MTEELYWTPAPPQMSGRQPLNTETRVAFGPLDPGLVRVDLVVLTLNMGIPDLIAVANACWGEPGADQPAAGNNILTLAGSPPMVLGSQVYGLTPQTQYAYTQVPFYSRFTGAEDENPQELWLDFQGVDAEGGSYACLSVYTSVALAYGV